MHPVHDDTDRVKEASAEDSLDIRTLVDVGQEEDERRRGRGIEGD